MAYRNKTYVCFDGDTDMHYYRMMTAWSENDKFSFDFHNAHDLNTARDSSQEERIKKQLRERFANSKLIILLIGEKTKYNKGFVKWELETALKLDLPIVAVNLNKQRQKDDLCHPIMKEELAIFVPFGAVIVECAMKNWPDEHARYKREGKTGSYYYTDQTYKNLGL